MGDQPSYYEPNQPTNFRTNYDYKHTVPPAKVHYDQGRPTLQISSHCVPIPRTTAQYGSLPFLDTLTRCSNLLNGDHSMSKWTYEARREAQYILPFLMLGPMGFARDVDAVRQAGITMMVAVRSKKVAESNPNLFHPARSLSAQGLETATFDVDTAFDISTGRVSIVKAINDHLEASCAGRNVQRAEDIPGKVLIYCETGSHRSPVLVAVYLMTVWGLDANAACQVVQARRFGIGMAPEMISMLRNLDSYFQAERQVTEIDGEESRESGGTLVGPKAMKRNIKEISDSDDEMTGLSDSMDGDGNGNGNGTTRPGIAPFKDSVERS